MAGFETNDKPMVIEVRCKDPGCNELGLINSGYCRKHHVPIHDMVLRVDKDGHRQDNFINE